MQTPFLLCKILFNTTLIPSLTSPRYISLNLRNNARESGDDSQNFTSLSRHKESTTGTSSGSQRGHIIVRGDDNSTDGIPMQVSNMIPLDFTHGLALNTTSQNINRNKEQYNNGNMKTPMALAISLNTETTTDGDYSSSQVSNTLQYLVSLLDDRYCSV